MQTGAPLTSQTCQGHLLLPPLTLKVTVHFWGRLQVKEIGAGLDPERQLQTRELGESESLGVVG